MERPDLNTMTTVDYILVRHCGGIGKWQLQNSIFVLLVWFASCYPLFITIFTTYAPDHRCYVDFCDTSNHTVATDWIPFAIPKRESTDKFLSTGKNCNVIFVTYFATLNFSGNYYDSCSMYARNTANADCNADSFDSKKIIPCKRYVYDQYYFDETLATKFDLICDNEYKSQLLHVIMMLGILIGSVVGGTLGDKFGRKLVMMVAAFIMCPVILGSGFIPNYGGK